MGGYSEDIRVVDENDDNEIDEGGICVIANQDDYLNQKRGSCVKVRLLLYCEDDDNPDQYYLQCIDKRGKYITGIIFTRKMFVNFKKMIRGVD